jgi:2-hydroxychromene-2-carboxylate isomerase
VLTRTLASATFDPQALQTLAQSQDAKDRLKATTDETVARGAFGAPTFFIGEEMFFGQDRLDWVEHALQK